MMMSLLPSKLVSCVTIPKWLPVFKYYEQQNLLTVFLFPKITWPMDDDTTKRLSNYCYMQQLLGGSIFSFFGNHNKFWNRVVLFFKKSNQQKMMVLSDSLISLTCDSKFSEYDIFWHDIITFFKSNISLRQWHHQFHTNYVQVCVLFKGCQLFKYGELSACADIGFY